ncbi:Pecanex-like protein 1 [Dactylosporangium sp. CS-047395]|uniref:Pecanex-like protein 1 n=1 Tax=Dactylosporangium sp. CS-047395 TaxID=3239936 RepID=UPI003D8DEF09
MQRRSARWRGFEDDEPDRSLEDQPQPRSKIRVITIIAAVVAFGAGLATTQLADAATRKRGPGQGQAPAACATTPGKTPATGAGRTNTANPNAKPSADTPPEEGADPSAGAVPKPNQTAGDVDGGNQNGHRVTNHLGDGQVNGRPQWRRVNPNCPTPAPTNTGSTGATGVPSAGSSNGTTLETLGNDCSQSRLAAHTGFQDAPRCVSTAFGEVSSQDKNPTLLITRAPQRVRVGQAFTLQVSTRNLVRDRFLGAAAGGYYLESAFLTPDGLTRGHFHTACRMLASTRSAPDPTVAPAFFVATEDKAGGSQPDTVTINVTGMPTAGTAQCASWAGDGSHRIPMMQKANEVPAFDSVRITVTN